MKTIHLLPYEAREESGWNSNHPTGEKVITGDADGRHGHLKSLPFQADCMRAALLKRKEY